MTKTKVWIEAFDAAIAMGFTPLQAGLIAEGADDALESTDAKTSHA